MPYHTLPGYRTPTAILYGDPTNDNWYGILDIRSNSAKQQGYST